MRSLTLFLVLACSAPEPEAPPAARTEPPQAAEEPPEMPIRADLHVDTPTQLHLKELPFDAPEGLEAGLPQLRAGGTQLTVQILWPPRKAEWRSHVFTLLERLEGELARLDALTLVRSPEETREAAAAGRHAVVLGLEGAHGLGEDWRADLHELHRRGLAVLGLTWSFSNRFAGSSGDKGGGLTEDGRALVAEARRLGLLIDLSHASRQTTLEVCEGAPAPVIASHSDVLVLRDHPRNLSDEEIRCIAETGGVIGVNLHRPFLPPGGDVAAAADVADHLRAVGGEGAPGLGSDYDGMIRTPDGLPDAAALPALWAELERRGWSEDELTAMQGENFMRAWAGAQAAASQ
ncbi:MAG: membrane dipeptidase [Alphaproteobacteria bacterium]|nr:membrane dipeptidase [Alphaproteobacteria bacterium]